MATPRRIRKPMPLGGRKTAWPSELLGGNFSPNCLNIRFRFGKAKPTPGRGLFDASPVNEQVLYIGHFPLITGIIWPFMLTQTKLFRRGNSAPNTPPVWSQITPPGGLTISPGRWGVASGESHLFFCNGTAELTAWDGISASFAKVSAAAGYQGPQNGNSTSLLSSYFLEYFDTRIFVANVTETPSGTPIVYQNRVRWAESGTYFHWNENAQLGAGFLDLWEEFSEPLTGMRGLGDVLVIYRRHTISHMIPTGTLAPTYAEYVRVRGMGCVAPYTLASSGQAHFFLGHDNNVWMWDGTQITAVGDPIYEELQAIIQASLYNTYFGFCSQLRQEYWLILCNPNASTYDVFVYDYNRQSWTRDSFPNLMTAGEIDLATTAFTWQTIPGSWATQGATRSWVSLQASIIPTLIGGRTDGATMLIDESVTYDYYALGSILESFLETEDMYFDGPAGQAGDPMEQGTVIRLQLVYEYVNNTPFEVGLSNDRGATWQTVMVTPSTKGYSFADLRSTSNVVRFRFRENSANVAFRWSSYAYDFVPAGEFIGTT